METKLIDFFEELYQNMNIYQALIVYCKEQNVIDIASFTKCMTSHDFPVKHLNDEFLNEKQLQNIESRYRIFLMDDLYMKNVYLPMKKNGMRNIDVVVCLDGHLHEKIKCMLKSTPFISEFLYLFSPIIIQ